jgi:hypothetical protein
MHQYIDFVWLHNRILFLENQIKALEMIIRELRPLLLKNI